MKRNFISILDWTSEEIQANIELALELKKLTKQGECPKLLEQKVYAMIFHKESLRTRVSFEVGIFQLGGAAIHLTANDFVLGERESVPDVAQVTSRFVDGILIRTFEHQSVIDLSKYAEVPVVNMLTDWNHPCQVMADALTIQEHFKKLKGLKIAYLGDGNNMTNSWLCLAARIPLNLSIGTSPDSLPDMDLFERVKSAGLSEVSISHSAEEAVENADVLYTDVWASMGKKDQAKRKIIQLKDFQINQKLLERAKSEAIVMHCLPAERGLEITDEVLDGPQSVVLDQAENRLHAQKAILVQLARWQQNP
ncbi:MAG: ornithine carbamoyltransferase [SAR324 cluster bacterium]|nr:ornithine carbamoyltransferase [SAR324 cluster bacterium]